MARTRNRRGPAAQRNREAEHSHVCRMAAYVRLSDTSAYSESDSIENQKRLIMDAIGERPDMVLAGFYEDDSDKIGLILYSKVPLYLSAACFTLLSPMP